MCCGSRSWSLFQSTHPRGVRPQHAGDGVEIVGVSIHAPAWGATCEDFTGCWVVCVSIHAPAWGATGAPPGARTRSAGFNPRTRVGCDGNLCGLRRGLAHVSIHAPAWGATRSIRSPSRSRSSFNPRTRVGCDYPAQLRYAKATISFNPRTRVGCDRNPASSRASPSSFNPRTRVGCDGIMSGAFLRKECFNPRTRVGCDLDALHKLLSQNWFQSTHPRGVRHRPSLRVSASKPVSIHAPAWGATVSMFYPVDSRD